MEGTINESAEVIENINANILKGFKTLRKSNPSLYTTASDNNLVSMNNTSALIYTNPLEITFNGSFKVIRNKLIPIEEDLTMEDIDPINLVSHGVYNKKILKFQQYVLDKQIRLNFIECIPMIKRLLVEYDSFEFFITADNKQSLFEFKKKNESVTRFITNLV